MVDCIVRKQKRGFPSRFFRIDESCSTMRTEIVAGLTTFFAMACILVVNPQVLAAPFVLRGDMEYVSQIANGVFFVTCPIAFPGTFLMAVYVKVRLRRHRVWDGMPFSHIP